MSMPPLNSSRALPPPAPDAQHLQTAWEQAIQARVRAEKRVAELEAERSARGKRTAQLRQTVSEAERWLMQKGMAMEAAA